jgi:glycosyltransferase involved in cell wall biosynthesis
MAVPSRPRLCIVSAVPISLTAFMAPHVRALAAGADITLVASTAPDPAAARWPAGVRFHAQHIARGIAPAADAASLAALWRFFRAERFDMVQSITPKAGLLAMIAGRLAGVPTRVHWFTGQVWATRAGLFREVLKRMDRVIAASATHLLADSASQRAFLEAQGIVAPNRVVVLGDGSVCGVDTARFRPDPGARRRVRAGHGIPEKAVVALYLGRLTAEKGLPELGEAFARVAAECQDLHLLVVGPDEGGMEPRLREASGAAGSRLHVAPATPQPEIFMAASDLFVLPSHREGFGSSVIEAAACEVPAVATSIYGLTDAVVDGETGLLVGVRQVDALASAIRALVLDPSRRRGMGAAARERVLRQFAQERLTAEYSAFAARVLASAGAGGG